MDEVAEQFGLKVLGKLPMDHKLAALCDKGLLELMENTYLDAALEEVEKATADK